MLLIMHVKVSIVIVRSIVSVVISIIIHTIHVTVGGQQLLIISS